MTISLYSIAIFVTDIDRAMGFYRDALGLPLANQGPFGAEFMEEGTHIGVHPAVHPDGLAMVGRHTGITLQVKRLLDFCEGLHEKGVRFVNEPTRQSWGIMALVSDPDGNVIALWEPSLPEETGIGT